MIECELKEKFIKVLFISKTNAPICLKFFRPIFYIFNLCVNKWFFSMIRIRLKKKKLVDFLQQKSWFSHQSFLKIRNLIFFKILCSSTRQSDLLTKSFCIEFIRRELASDNPARFIFIQLHGYILYRSNDGVAYIFLSIILVKDILIWLEYLFAFTIFNSLERNMSRLNHSSNLYFVDN